LSAVPVISLESISKAYANGRVDVEALREIDLEIQPGELVSIAGPSGSGKTTMLEILGCLSQPTSGCYRFNGKRLESFPPDHLAKLRGEEIGFVFQSFNLLPRLTALENVELPLSYRGVPRRERRERAREALGRVGLADRVSHLPSEMSGGERQRVAIARALINRPSLILADEPTGNLDTEAGNGVLALLRKLNDEGSTVVIVSHDAAVVAQAERQIRIRDGRLEADRRAR